MEDKELFKVKVDLMVFEALQRDGTLSFEKLSDKTKIHPTTVQYAVERLRKRNFYEIKAVPKLNKFQLPMAVIGFSDAHPIALERLEKIYGGKQEVRLLIRGEKEIILFLMDSNKERLSRKLFDIMNKMNQKPSIYITAPQIVKFEATIPDKILDKLYADLPDRRFK